MNCLVLGGNGFIGSHLVDALLAAGSTVRVYDRGPEKYREPLKGVQYFTGEFADTALLGEALTSVDVVYHLISTTVPSTSNLDPYNDISSNLINTVRLLDLMRLQKVPKIVYLSSGGTVYGIPQFSPIRETHTLRPISSYGAVKVAIENYLHIYKHLHGLEYVVLRASNPYGPRQGHLGVQGVIGTYLQRINSGQPIEVWGDGSVVRDYIFIDDLVSLCVSAGQAEKEGVFNAGSGTGYTITEIVQVVTSVCESSVEVVFKDGRSFDVPRSILDITKAIEILEWQPTVTIEDGVMQAWRWIRGRV